MSRWNELGRYECRRLQWIAFPMHPCTHTPPPPYTGHTLPYPTPTLHWPHPPIPHPHLTHPPIPHLTLATPSHTHPHLTLATPSHTPSPPYTGHTSHTPPPPYTTQARMVMSHIATILANQIAGAKFMTT